MKPRMQYRWILPVVTGMLSAVILTIAPFEHVLSRAAYSAPLWLVAIWLVGGPGVVGLLLPAVRLFGKEFFYGGIVTISLFWFHIGWRIDAYRVGTAPNILVGRSIRIALSVLSVCLSIAAIYGVLNLEFAPHILTHFESLLFWLPRWGLFFALQSYGIVLVACSCLLWAVGILLFSSWRLWVNCRPLWSFHRPDSSIES